MGGKQEIEALAEKIRREIDSSGTCSISGKSLAPLLGQAPRPSLENQLNLANFSIQYGFIHRADEELKTVSFRKLA